MRSTSTTQSPPTTTGLTPEESAVLSDTDEALGALRTGPGITPTSGAVRELYRRVMAYNEARWCMASTEAFSLLPMAMFDPVADRYVESDPEGRVSWRFAVPPTSRRVTPISPGRWSVGLIGNSAPLAVTTVDVSYDLGGNLVVEDFVFTDGTRLSQDPGLFPAPAFTAEGVAVTPLVGCYDGWALNLYVRVDNDRLRPVEMTIAALTPHATGRLTPPRDLNPSTLAGGATVWDMSFWEVDMSQGARVVFALNNDTGGRADTFTFEVPALAQPTSINSTVWFPLSGTITEVELPPARRGG